MPEQTESSDLEGMLDELTNATEESGPISVGELMNTIGQRSFGPLMLAPALIALTPLGGIPGLPTALAVRREHKARAIDLADVADALVD